MRYGMVIDLKRCIGCYGCQIACKAENATPPGVLLARVKKLEQGKYPNVRKTSLPLLCFHCKEPACLAVCPTGATEKSEETGVVTVDKDKCVGCRACMMACPYGSRYFHAKLREYYPGQGLTPFEKVGYQKHPTGVVEKCDFCSHKLAEAKRRGLKPGVDREVTPSCVANCMCEARFFGDLDDPASEVAHLIATGQAFQLHPELGTDPSVYYLPPR